MKATSSAEATFTNGFIRTRGMAIFALGSILFLFMVSTMDRLTAGGHSVQFALIPTCISFAIAAAGFVELVSRTPYHRLGRNWAALRGWQRGMIGIFIAVTSLVILACVGAFLAMFLA
jgi:hypothetical protein